MHILSNREEINNLMHSFHLGLARDPICWADWVLINITSAERDMPDLTLDAQTHFATIINGILSGKDGVMCCLDSGNLVVMLEEKNLNPDAFLRELNSHTTLTLPTLKFDVFFMKTQYLEVMDMVQVISGEFTAPVFPKKSSPLSSSISLPHIGDLLKVWMVAHKARAGRASPHILLVEDDALTRHVVTRDLKENYPVITATNAVEAVEKHLTTTPDIVFLDIDLPDSDGFTVLNYIRNYDPHCKIVMFSSNGYMENRLKALSAGAEGFIVKPYNRTSFAHYISDWYYTHDLKEGIV